MTLEQIYKDKDVIECQKCKWFARWKKLKIVAPVLDKLYCMACGNELNRKVTK